MKLPYALDEEVRFQINKMIMEQIQFPVIEGAEVVGNEKVLLLAEVSPF